MAQFYCLSPVVKPRSPFARSAAMNTADLIAIGPDEWTILGEEVTTHWHIDVKGDRAECTLYPPGEFAVSFREALSTWIDARSR